jgi:hypothetical protein
MDRPRVARSALDLSHEYKTTFDFGQLIPVSTIECIPGDIFRLGAAAVLRMQPMLAPILHTAKLRYYSFFVPYRLLWDEWEDFITGGEDGTFTATVPVFDPDAFTASISSVVAVGSLWDYLGYNPVGTTTRPHPSTCPHDFARRAYVMIWNEFFRIPGIQDERPLDVGVAGEVYQVLYRNWTRDYFTSALPFQQRGVAPALPVFGSITAASSVSVPSLSTQASANIANSTPPHFQFNNSTDNVAKPGVNLSGAQQANWAANMASWLQSAIQVATSVSSNLSSVDIADLRLAWQTQVYLERNARGGARYTEQLQARYGTQPLDARLQRPEFIGGYTSPFLFSEVLQTSASNTQPTPQGNMAGHGINVDAGTIGSYRVEEHGLIMVLACVDPTPAYQQGIHRSWLRRTRLDFPAPEFVNLSEQEIYNQEIYCRTTAQDPNGQGNIAPFGYTGIYNEMRYLPNIVTGEMRNTFDYWHLARKFSSLPVLNGNFVSIGPDLAQLKRIYAVQNVPGIIGNFGIKVTAVRPLPYMPIPSHIGGVA